MSYRQGTISVINGSKAVVGTNTLFATVGVTAGDQLTLVDANGLATGAMYEVASVTDNTHLTLLQNYQGSTASGQSYAIIDMAGDSTVPNFARRLAQFYADIGVGASSTVKGLVKLYTALGSNTDGSITQAGLQTLFNGKINSNLINANNGVAGLDENAKVLLNNLPIIPPVGTVIACASQATPTGYLVCDGSAISRVTYSALFSAIGTTYGAGDGNTTFNLPNLIDMFIQGSNTAGTIKNAGLPNITGLVCVNVRDGGYRFEMWGDGAFYPTRGERGFKVTNGSYSPAVQYSGSEEHVSFSASRSSSIYGNSLTVQPPTVTMKPCIKY